MRAIAIIVLSLFGFASILHAESILIIKDPDTIKNTQVAKMQKNKIPLSQSQGEFVEVDGNCYLLFTGHAADGLVKGTIMYEDGPIEFGVDDILHSRVDEDIESGLDYAIAKLDKCKNIKKTDTVKIGDIVTINWLDFEVVSKNQKLRLKPLDAEKAKKLRPSDSGLGVYDKNGHLVALVTTKITNKETGEIEVDAVSVEFLLSLVNKKNKNVQADMLQHIMAGWHGTCEVGTVFDNPFNDPMKLLSYAMMVYSAAGNGAFGEDVQGSIDSMENSVSDVFSSSSDSVVADQQTVMQFKDGTLTAEQATSALGTANDGAGISEVVKTVKDINYLEDLSNFLGVDMYITDFIEIAMSAIDIKEDDIKEADDYMRSWMGDPNTSNQNAQAYASCMASIGLSFPNLTSAAIGDSHGSSTPLKAPWDNPLRLSERQLQTLAASTSESYVRNAYRVTGQSANLYTVVAWDAMAYQQAGQVICGGKMSKAINVLNTMNTNELGGDSGGNQAEAMTMAIARMAIQKVVPPPYNIIAVMVFDVITSIKDIDGCDNMQHAIQRGSLKVMQHQKFGQCHHVKTKCAAKWFWGDCMRDRKEYCCYPMIETRIIVEGLKAQLCKGWESCNDIGIEDLKNITFVPCEPGQNPCTDKCFPRDKYDEFFRQMTKGASRDMSGDVDGIMGQIRDLMTTERGMCD